MKSFLLPLCLWINPMEFQEVGGKEELIKRNEKRNDYFN